MVVRPRLRLDKLSAILKIGTAALARMPLLSSASLELRGESAQKASRQCSTGRVLPRLVMMSKGEIIGAPTAAASALVTLVAVSGSTWTSPDQMMMKAAVIKPIVTAAAMFLLIAKPPRPGTCVAGCYSEKARNFCSAHLRLRCVYRMTGLCGAHAPRRRQQETALQLVRQRPPRLRDAP
jgi:hypothetical protein